VRGLNLKTLQKEQRENARRAKPARVFKLPPERSPCASAPIGRGLRKCDLVWESVRHGKIRRMYYYCKKPRKGMGAYYAVVGVRGYYAKFGLRALNPDPRPLHEAAKWNSAKLESADVLAHVARFCHVMDIPLEFHPSGPHEALLPRLERETAASGTHFQEHENSGAMRHGAATTRFSLPALVLGRVEESGARACGIATHASETATGRAGQLSAPSMSQPQPKATARHSEQLPKPQQPQPESQEFAAPQALQPGADAGAEAARAKSMAQMAGSSGTQAVFAADAASSQANSQPAPVFAPVLEVVSAPVPDISSDFDSPAAPAAQLAMPAASQPGAPAKTEAKAARTVGFAPSASVVQIVPAETPSSPSAPKSETWGPWAAPSRAAPGVYIPPRIRRKAFTQQVVGAEALPD
jgi:hypothetical protein